MHHRRDVAVPMVGDVVLKRATERRRRLGHGGKPAAEREALVPRGEQHLGRPRAAPCGQVRAAQQAFNTMNTGSMGSEINLMDFPNVDFFYKMVAKVDGKYFSVYDANVEYQIGKALHE